MANKYLNFDGLSHLIDKLKASIAKKVDKEEGKMLSSNDYTDTEKTKLAGIEDGAEVNVQSDWSQNDETADDYIKNRTHYTDDAGAVHQIDMKYLPIVSDEEFFLWLVEAQIIDPATSVNGEIYTSKNNEVYVL